PRAAHGARHQPECAMAELVRPDGTAAGSQDAVSGAGARAGARSREANAVPDPAAAGHGANTAPERPGERARDGKSAREERSELRPSDRRPAVFLQHAAGWELGGGSRDGKYARPAIRD